MKTGIVSGVIPQRLFVTLQTLILGYALGLVIAALFTSLAVTTRIGTDLLSTLTAMFNPLPAIALLPLALLWFGLGRPSLIFVIIHSVLWAVALNMHSGFLSVSETQRMAGRTFGLVRSAPGVEGCWCRRHFQPFSPASRSAGRSPGAR